MTGLLFSSPWLFTLFCAAAMFALLGRIKNKLYWAVLSALCAITGTLASLVLDRTMDEILSVLLALTAISLLSLRKKEGGGKE